MFQTFILFNIVLSDPKMVNGSIAKVAGFPMQQKLHIPQIQAAPCRLCSAKNNNRASDTNYFYPGKCQNLLPRCV